jgi:aspartate/methionine/tyrosine aminotransferase
MTAKLAQELNATLEGTTPGALLSAMGKRLYFPKGIIAQGAEAKEFGKTANGTVGVAVKDGAPLILSAVRRQAPELSPGEIVSYAPTAGIPALRKLWDGEIRRKNPSLKDAVLSTPAAVSGLTAGLSAVCDLFLDEGQTLLAADPSWDNYSLIAETRRGAVLGKMKMFGDRGLELAAIEKALKKEAKSGFVRIILNFPQNPTGYSPTVSEAQSICAMIKKTAERGAKILVICDDAYYGLQYEEDIEPQSLFTHLAHLHENIFTVKIDGPTKEDFSWGLRCGFVTFAGKGLSAAHIDALSKKLTGEIRCSYSCSATLSQNILKKLYDEGGKEADRERTFFRNTLRDRYRIVREFVDKREGHPRLKAMPFNSGYFMSFRCVGIDAEELRQKLLHEKGIGTIAIDGETLRVAFSSLESEKIERIYTELYSTADSL